MHPTPIRWSRWPLPDSPMFRGNRVEVFDGLAYAASSSQLISVDLASREIVESLRLGLAPITDIAREGPTLYTMDSNGGLTVVDISQFQMLERGSVTVPDAGGRMSVSDGIAYAAATGFRGGFATADVSDPDNPLVISGSDWRQKVVGLCHQAWASSDRRHQPDADPRCRPRLPRHPPGRRRPDCRPSDRFAPAG